MIQRFLKWWEERTVHWIAFIVVVHIVQIPHMIWNADLLLELGVISRLNPISDFVLYGIDLIEIPSIAIAITTLAAYINKKRL